MTKTPDYAAINKKAWNERTEVHLRSDFYDNKSFLAGRNSLNPIERSLLGSLKGKSVLHLQCHFGQDTISLARLGARATGVDLSDKAIGEAKELARITKAKAEFICCNVYDLPKHLNKKFDVVFSSYGTIGWLPDLGRWAGLVARYLKPGGRFVFVEFHPVVWMFDDDFKEVKYRYFNAGPIMEYEEGTYADKKAAIGQEQVWWNHDLGEVIGSLLKKKLAIESFSEYDYSPYDCLGKMVKFAPGKFRVKRMGDKIPLVYSLVARK
jgi:SAM-dependent methyltransferase